MDASGVPVELKKYHFDRFNFDVDAIDPDNPPPPVFSESDLAAAKAESLAEGRKLGLKESQDSRDQVVASTLQKMSAALQTLIQGEATRGRIFEDELVAVVTALLAKAFPVFNTALGAQQISETIKKTLATLPVQSTVVIQVSPHDLQDVGDRLQPFLTRHEASVSLQPDPTIEPGGFQMKWQDGGAVRDPVALQQSLLNALQQALAVDPQNPHTAP